MSKLKSLVCLREDVQQGDLIRLVGTADHGLRNFEVAGYFSEIDDSDEACFMYSPSSVHNTFYVNLRNHCITNPKKQVMVSSNIRNYEVLRRAKK